MGGLNLRLFNRKCSTSATALPAAAPAGGTGATAGAYDTAAHRDELIALVNAMRIQLNLLIDELNA